MANEDIKQKLTAILSADVKDYSRLMNQDRIGTIETLKSYREIISNFVNRYIGRVIDTPGDNILAAFESVSDAVNGAVEIQRELAERNAEVPSARMMQWRIGISVGDVVEEEGRIYGDGVNIVARVEGLAEPGGICISGTVYDHVKNKLGLEFESLGEQEVKNIPEPIRVYRVLSYPGAAAHRVVKAKGDVTRKWRNSLLATAAVIIIAIISISVWNYISHHEIPPTETSVTEKATATAELEKPSIAVLPFTNMSRDPDQEYFSDGMTEEIINLLSKSQHLLVIARNATFTYKGEAIKPQKVGEELGAKFVLEGSVRKDGDRIRITAQLIDATTGNHIWSEKYDRKLTDIFDLQDEIAQQITINLIAEYKESELLRVRRITTDNLTAYDLYWRGLEQLGKYEKESNSKARDYFERAIMADPSYANAYAQLGLTYNLDMAFGWNSGPQLIKKAYELALKAIDLDESNARARYLLAWVYALQGKNEQAVSELYRATSLNPNDDASYLFLGFNLTSIGRHEEGVQLLEKTMRLNPLHRAYAIMWLGMAYASAGRYDDAIVAYQKAILRDPNYFQTYWALCMAYLRQWQVQKIHDPQNLDRALEIAQKAVALDETNSESRVYLSFAYLGRNEFDQAIVEIENAMNLNPNNSDCYLLKSQIYSLIDKPTEAIEMVYKARELWPELPNLGIRVLVLAYISDRRYEEALELAKQYSPTNYDEALNHHIVLALLYSKLDRVDEARAEAAEVLKLAPHFSVDIYGERSHIKDPERIESYKAALRKAGLK